MEDIITALFLRFTSREDALDLLCILWAEYSRQDNRRRECSTPFASTTPAWSGHYVLPDQTEPVARYAPVLVLQMLRDRFIHASESEVPLYWTFLRALILVLFMYDTRMRRLLLSSPNPFWPSPPPGRANRLLRQGGAFQQEVDAFLAVHDDTHSFQDAHIMAYDFVMRVESMWKTQVYVGEEE